MPRAKGHPKTGGRKVGSRNKPIASVLARLEQLKCDPVEGLASIATEAREEGDSELAAYCYRCLLPYVYPRLGILDVKVTDESPFAQFATEDLQMVVDALKAIEADRLMATTSERLINSEVSPLPKRLVIDAEPLPAVPATRPQDGQAAARPSDALAHRVSNPEPPGESGGPIPKPRQQVPNFPAAVSAAMPGLQAAHNGAGGRCWIGPPPRQRALVPADPWWQE